MAEVKQKVPCIACGESNTVTVVTTQTRYSRIVKVVKCTSCKHQAGVLATLKKV